jgi:hypothetical protein
VTQGCFGVRGWSAGGRSPVGAAAVAALARLFPPQPPRGRLASLPRLGFGLLLQLLSETAYSSPPGLKRRRQAA